MKKASYPFIFAWFIRNLLLHARSNIRPKDDKKRFFFLVSWCVSTNHEICERAAMMSLAIFHLPANIEKYYLGQDYFGNDFDENNRNVCFHTKILFAGDITPFLNPALITFLRRVDILWVVLLSHLFHNMGSTSRVFGCHEKNSIWFLSCLKLHTKNVISTSVIISKISTGSSLSSVKTLPEDNFVKESQKQRLFYLSLLLRSVVSEMLW